MKTAAAMFPSVQCLATGKLFADSHDHDSIATALAAAVQAHQLEADFISVERFSAAVAFFDAGPRVAAVQTTPEALDAALTHAGTLNKIAGVADLFSELSASRVDVKASRAEDRELANLLREVSARGCIRHLHAAAIHMLRCVVCADG